MIITVHIHTLDSLIDAFGQENLTHGIDIIHLVYGHDGLPTEILGATLEVDTEAVPDPSTKLVCFGTERTTGRRWKIYDWMVDAVGDYAGRDEDDIHTLLIDWTHAGVMKSHNYDTNKDNKECEG